MPQSPGTRSGIRSVATDSRRSIRVTTARSP
jgi:hypothetical protein